MNLPYFITWTKQAGAFSMELEKVSTHSFYIQEDLSTSLKKVTDLSSMSYQAGLGLKNTTITRAMKTQMNSFSMALPKHTFALKEEISNKLNQYAKRRNPKTGKLTKSYKTFFTLSGSEGIENALKMARQVTSRKIILARKDSYHGATMGALAVTGDWRNDQHPLPRQWTVRIPSPQEDPKGQMIEAIILKHGPDKIAAFCLETITGGNGVIIPHTAYYKKIQTLASRYKIKIIMDEVVCGVHRTGPFFGIDHYPFLKPDFIVMAKALTGGFFPLGAVLVCEKIAKYYDKNVLSCGLTNYAHPLGLAAIAGVFEVIEKTSFQKNVENLSKSLKKFADSLREKEIIVRQIGLLMAIELPSNISQEELIGKGVYISIINNNMIIAPHLNMPLKKLDHCLNIIKKFF